MRMIEDDIRTALGAEFARVEVRTVLSPAWTTDWMSEQGRAALRAYGVAPPETPVAPAVAPAGPRHRAAGRLSALRSDDDRAGQRVRFHRVQGALSLPVLPRAV